MAFPYTAYTDLAEDEASISQVFPHLRYRFQTPHFSQAAFLTYTKPSHVCTSVGYVTEMRQHAIVGVRGGVSRNLFAI